MKYAQIALENFQRIYFKYSLANENKKKYYCRSMQSACLRSGIELSAVSSNCLQTERIFGVDSSFLFWPPSKTFVLLIENQLSALLFQRYLCAVDKRNSLCSCVIMTEYAITMYQMTKKNKQILDMLVVCMHFDKSRSILRHEPPCFHCLNPIHFGWWHFRFGSNLSQYLEFVLKVQC